MKEFKHLASNRKKRLTFIIIPNSTGRVIEFTIPQWIPALSFTIIGLLIFAAIISTGSLYSTTTELHTTQENLAELKIDNQQKTNEIAALNLRTAEIESQLLGLDKLKGQVLDMVGLETANDKNLEDVEVLQPFLMVSRSSQLASSIGSYGIYSEDDMDYLELLIENQKTTMDSLISEVEEQLKYLEALPNLTPAEGRISSPFGYRVSPINGRREFHNGMDIANRTNTDIVAAGSGVVTYSGYNGGYGRMIIISHGNGYSSVYAHNNQNLVTVGQRVTEGEVIAKMGSTGRSTGPHVHFEVRLNGESIDPMELLKK